MLDLDAIAEVVAETVRAETAPILAENAALRKRLDEMEARAPIPGERGEQGAKGEPGTVDMDAVKALVEEAVAALPAPEKGEDGADGQDGRQGERGEQGERGADGAGISDLLIDRDGCLVASFSDGRTKNMGVVVGKDGRDGVDGANGKDGAPGEAFTLDDFDIQQEEDGRTFIAKFMKGSFVHSFEFEIPVPIMRGAFKEGASYRKGDMVVWGGNLWHAMKDTVAKPDSPDSGWMIAARKGRDGKDAKA